MVRIQKLNKNEQFNDHLIKTTLESFQNEHVFNELDYLMTPEEMEKTIQSVKNAKYSQTVCIPLV